MNYKHLKQTYFIKTIVDTCNKNEDIVFNSSVTNLYELGRQYKNIPDGIKELSSPKLIKSFEKLVSNSTFITDIGKGFIIDKNIKVLSQSLFAFSQLNSTKSIEAIYNIIINQRTAIGSVKNLTKLIEQEKEINELNKYETIELQFLAELIDLICSYLIHIGYSYDSLYGNYNNYYSRYLRREISLDDCYDFIVNDLNQKIRNGKDKTQIEDFKLKIIKEGLIKSNVENTFRKICEEEEIFQDYIKKWSISKISKDTIIIAIKINYTDYARAKEVLHFLVHKIEIYLRCFPNSTEIETYRVSDTFYSKVVQEKKKKIKLNLNLKYFNELFEKSKWDDIKSESYQSIWRIADWYEKISETEHDKEVLFTSLWSALEFMLIGDSKGDKKDEVYKRLLPYMGLFFFRKTFKMNYKDLALSRISYSRDGLSSSFAEMNEFIHSELEKSPSKSRLPSDLSTANKYLVYMLEKDFEDRWRDFDFKEADSLYIKLNSELTLLDLKGQIQRFENVIYNDLDQIYRLRNMLTHSGINDDITLNNTFNRLKYYVQSIINSISYSYLYNPSMLIDFEHLHQLKESDYKKYKESLMKNLDKDRKDFTRWIKLMELGDDYVVTIPPNAYNSFRVE